MRTLFKVEKPTVRVSKEAHIADIHFGCIEPVREYEILKNQFLDKITKLKLDLVSINGDLFDHKFMSNSDAVYYAMRFIDDLVNYSRRTGCTLILLHGTESHDSHQLKLFYNYIGTCDIRIIERACFTNVKGKRYLCIPELYNMGEEYYSKFLYESGTYDGCILHGTIVNSIYGCNKEDLNSKREPIFSIDNFMYCRGPIICGHVHKPQCLNKDIYYCGSPIRYQFGEEELKGFYILLHDLISNRYLIHFNEIYSFIYDTINIDNKLGIIPVENLVEYINNYISSKNVDKLRIVYSKNIEDMAILKSFFNTRKDIVFKPDEKLRELRNSTNEDEEFYNKYSFISENNMSPEQKLVQYINESIGHEYITFEDLEYLLKDE